MDYTIVIFNEVTGAHLNCDQCDMFIPWEATTEGNLGTAILKKEAEWKSHRLAAAAIQDIAGTDGRVWERVLD